MGIRCSSPSYATALIILALASACAFGDKVYLKDGRVLEGRVISKSDREVTFEIRRAGSAMVMRVPMTDVIEVVVANASTQPTSQSAGKSPNIPEGFEIESAPANIPDDAGASADGVGLQARPGAGPTYLTLPVYGEIGLYVSASLFQTYFRIAGTEKPDLVILDFDCPGGSVQELDKLLDLLSKQQHLTIVAYVRNAHSAAAILAMACPKVVMAPGGSIGGAVIYQITPWGTPQNIEEKMQSIYRAKFRSAASNAGHEPLLVEGMMRTDLILSEAVEGGRARIVEGIAPGQRVIKPAGRILTLTSEEAVACGLANGICESVQDCDTLLGLEDCAERSRSAITAYRTHKKATDEAASRYAGVIGAANAALADAEKVNPGQFTYWVDTNTGRFTQESERQWRERSDACAWCLSQAASFVSAAKNVIARYPNIQYHPALADKAFAPEVLVQIARNIATVSDAVAADAKRKGFPPR